MTTKTKTIIIFILVIISASIVFSLDIYQNKSDSSNNIFAQNSTLTPSSAKTQNNQSSNNISKSPFQNSGTSATVSPTQLASLSPTSNIPESPKPNTGIVFLEDFQTTYSVVEVDKLINRTSPGWWLDSGAYFYSHDGIGSTAVGPLSSNDPSRISYLASNPTDTDNGYYPQNIFRLVLTRGKWQNFQQELDFKIINNNLSSSPNRNESNGLFFFNRYQDSNNLYYTGIRVDGAAVIKKKINGVYYELAKKQFFKNSTYNTNTNPNLIPAQKWISLRSEIITNPDNTVSIKLFIDKDSSGNWVLATEAKDSKNAILNEGYTGIRTDFMDVEFDNHKVTQE